MATNDAATLVIGAGNFYTAPVGTAMPSDLSAAPSAPWENVGHTSLEDIFSTESEGGEATILGTLQNKSLRTKYSTRTEKFTITLQQFDEAGLKLYYGSNASVAVGGELEIPNDPTPTQAAFLAVFVDGSNHFGIWVPKAEIYRADDLALSDTESLAGLPIGITPLQYQTNDFNFAVTPLGGA